MAQKAVFNVLARAFFHARTVYLFTKSDMKTILFPIALFAWCTAPKLTLTSFARSFIWIWLHLLQFCVSNQHLSPHEDALNKPWRPIPGRRITIRHATILRWLLLPICLAFSAAHRVFPIGVTLAVGIFLHNEMRLDSHWFTRNVLNAIGYAVFDAGATVIARTDPSFELSSMALAAHYLSIAIVFTTIHAQDFRDEVGDRQERRRTIPIVMPEAGRLSMPIGLLAWSLALGMLRLSPVIRVSLIGMGGLVGLRFYCLRTAEADKTSYLLYNLWLAIARISPVYAQP
ncbi:hypothetical protein PENSPDRAFT_654071 [Peniophora sp. CONT]|nr:hypothetical protein PENSPDRAFT_654071 [Peniophora sp. CONT]